jgi:hypothetical protein
MMMLPNIILGLGLNICPFLFDPSKRAFYALSKGVKKVV